MEKMQAVKNTIHHLDDFVQKVNYCRSGPDNPDLDHAIYDLKQKFSASMNDDFNTASALAALFQFTRSLNTIMDKNGLSSSAKKKVAKSLEKIDQVLGVMDLEPAKTDKDIETLIEKREQARKAKDWDTADALRRELKEKGVTIVDTKEGPAWRKVKVAKG